MTHQDQIYKAKFKGKMKWIGYFKVFTFNSNIENSKSEDLLQMSRNLKHKSYLISVYYNLIFIL